jgi:hypothetical protein
VETNRAFFMQTLSLVRIAAFLTPNRRFRQARLCAWSGRSPGDGRMSKLPRAFGASYVPGTLLARTRHRILPAPDFGRPGDRLFDLGRPPLPVFLHGDALSREEVPGKCQARSRH